MFSYLVMSNHRWTYASLDAAARNSAGVDAPLAKPVMCVTNEPKIKF